MPVMNGRPYRCSDEKFIPQVASLFDRRFNFEMQQAGINGMAERAVDKAGGVKGLPPEAVGA